MKRRRITNLTFEELFLAGLLFGILAALAWRC